MDGNVASIIHLVTVQAEKEILEPGFVNFIVKCYPGHLSYFKGLWISFLPSDIQMDRKGCTMVNENCFIVCFLEYRGSDKILTYMMFLQAEKIFEKHTNLYLLTIQLFKILRIHIIFSWWIHYYFWGFFCTKNTTSIKCFCLIYKFSWTSWNLRT